MPAVATLTAVPPTPINALSCNICDFPHSIFSGNDSKHSTNSIMEAPTLSQVRKHRKRESPQHYRMS